MNLYVEGKFAASDWLLQKLQHSDEPLALLVMPNGSMRLRDPAKLGNELPAGYVGTYRREGFSVAAAREDLEVIAREHRWPTTGETKNERQAKARALRKGVSDPEVVAHHGPR